MEAASARAAARDRWSAWSYPRPSQLQRFIASACSPENYEPNLALNLEIADLINSKKGTAPREAAVAIVKYINSYNSYDPKRRTNILALNLLDICVKNCGYPFHLQIATKEFLNELVRRFPERPPMRYSEVQTKILELIEEWRCTICETSRYKEDLGYIRDMHALLHAKGYRFPEVRRDDAAVLNPSDSLKSAEEMEEEEREAQSAKLQELIRRGTPEDLQQANQLMKVMAGYDTRSKVDYRAKAAEDVGKILAKARLLEERLSAIQPGEKLTDGDVFEELAASLRSAQPKIQKMCEEESDDHEAVAKLFEINDSIHRTIERWKLIKKGDIAGAEKLAQGAPLPGPSSSTGPAASAANELSLIDFDAEASSNGMGNDAGPSSQSGAGGVADDLLGLSLGESSGYGQGGGISLGLGTNQNTPGSSLFSSMAQSTTGMGPAPTMNTQSSDPFAGFPSQPASQSNTPKPLQNQTSVFSQPPPQQAAAPPSDPFAALASPHFSSRSATPKPAAAPPAAAAPAAATSNDDDEWSFYSAPPAAPALPKEHSATVKDGPLQIKMKAGRSQQAGNAITFMFSFSNMTPQPIDDIGFQLAVTKGYELQLQSPSARSLQPNQQQGIMQAMQVWHANDRSRKVDSIKLRWRVTYSLGGEVKNEMGEIPEFAIA